MSDDSPAPLLPGQGTVAFLGIDSRPSVSMGAKAGCGVKILRLYARSNGFAVSQRLASLATYRSLALTRNGLMLRGIFGLLALVFDLPSIFLALVLDCLSVMLSLLGHTHNRLLSALGTDAPRRALFSEKRRRSDPPSLPHRTHLKPSG
jgi:hypothetical protein